MSELCPFLPLDHHKAASHRRAGVRNGCVQVVKGRCYIQPLLSSSLRLTSEQLNETGQFPPVPGDMDFLRRNGWTMGSEKDVLATTRLYRQPRQAFRTGARSWGGRHSGLRGMSLVNYSKFHNSNNRKLLAAWNPMVNRGRTGLTEHMFYEMFLYARLKRDKILRSKVLHVRARVKTGSQRRMERVQASTENDDTVLRLTKRRLEEDKIRSRAMSIKSLASGGAVSAAEPLDLQWVSNSLQLQRMHAPDTASSAPVSHSSSVSRTPTPTSPRPHPRFLV